MLLWKLKKKAWAEESGGRCFLRGFEARLKNQEELNEGTEKILAGKDHSKGSVAGPNCDQEGQRKRKK